MLSPSAEQPAAAPMSLARAVDLWLDDGQAQGWSPRTVGNRRHLMSKLGWWLANEAELAPTLASLSPMPS
jgi:hypothetical protein